MSQPNKPSHPTLQAALLAATRPQSLERMTAVSADVIAAYNAAPRCLGCGLACRRGTCPGCEG